MDDSKFGLNKDKRVVAFVEAACGAAKPSAKETRASFDATAAQLNGGQYYFSRKTHGLFKKVQNVAPIIYQFQNGFEYTFTWLVNQTSTN